MKVPINELLSPILVDRFAQIGVAAQHVVHLGKSGLSDPEIWKYAFEHDQVVVTMNYGDFITLAAASEVHAGLVVLRQGGLRRDEQWQILLPVVEKLKDVDLLNKVVEVTGVGRFSVRELPTAGQGLMRRTWRGSWVTPRLYVRSWASTMGAGSPFESRAAR